MPLSFLWSWLTRRRPDPLDHVRVVLYTRDGCHLCASAWQQLRLAQQQHGFALSAVDVDTDQELVRLHGDQVPVVTVNGKVRFRGGVNPALLTRLLRAAGGRGKKGTGLSTP